LFLFLFSFLYINFLDKTKKAYILFFYICWKKKCRERKFRERGRVTRCVCVVLFVFVFFLLIQKICYIICNNEFEPQVVFVALKRCFSYSLFYSFFWDSQIRLIFEWHIIIPLSLNSSHYFLNRDRDKHLLRSCISTYLI
jgi:hypothetical protein